MPWGAYQGTVQLLFLTNVYTKKILLESLELQSILLVIPSILDDISKVQWYFYFLCENVSEDSLW